MHGSSAIFLAFSLLLTCAHATNFEYPNSITMLPEPKAEAHTPESDPKPHVENESEKKALREVDFSLVGESIRAPDLNELNFTGPIGGVCEGKEGLQAALFDFFTPGFSYPTAMSRAGVIVDVHPEHKDPFYFERRTLQARAITEKLLPLLEKLDHKEILSAEQKQTKDRLEKELKSTLAEEQKAHKDHGLGNYSYANAAGFILLNAEDSLNTQGKLIFNKKELGPRKEDPTKITEYEAFWKSDKLVLKITHSTLKKDKKTKDDESVCESAPLGWIKRGKPPTALTAETFKEPTAAKNSNYLASKADFDASNSQRELLKSLNFKGKKTARCEDTEQTYRADVSVQKDGKVLTIDSTRDRAEVLDRKAKAEAVAKASYYSAVAVPREDELNLNLIQSLVGNSALRFEGGATNGGYEYYSYPSQDSTWFSEGKATPFRIYEVKTSGSKEFAKVTTGFRNARGKDTGIKVMYCSWNKEGATP